MSVNDSCGWVKKLLNAGCLKGVGSVTILVVSAGVTAVDNSPALGCKMLGCPAFGPVIKKSICNILIFGSE